MSYTVYWTNHHPDKIPNANQMVAVTADSLGTAIMSACSLILKGSVVLQINGSHGFRMERTDIENECRRRKALYRDSIAASPISRPVKRSINRL